MSVSPGGITYAGRRNLPHWRREGAVYWVTFRLADSLPQSKLDQLRNEKDAWLHENPEPWSEVQVQHYQTWFGERVQEWLDAGYGCCALKQPEVRQCVRACLTRFDGERLRLHAAVIMPNHVHALIEPDASDTGIPACGLAGALAGMSVSFANLLKGIKGASARAANQLLGRTGRFWLDESYDRIVRNREEYDHFVDYIRANPVKAGLKQDEFWLHC